MLKQILALLLLLLLFSCSNISKDTVGQVKSLIALEASNSKLYESVLLDVSSIKQCSYTEYSYIRCKIWKPKVLQLHKSFDSLFTFIDAKKNELNRNKFYPLDMYNGYDSLVRLENKVADKAVWNNTVRSNFLKKYENLLAILSDSFSLSNDSYNISIPNEKKQLFDDEYVQKQSILNTPLSNLLLDNNLDLASIKNRLLLKELALIEYAMFRCYRTGLLYESFIPICSISSSVVLPGGHYEVNVEFCSGSNKSVETLLINHTELGLTNDLVTYQGIAPIKKGQYSIPIEIYFRNENDEQEVLQKSILLQVVDTICVH